MNKTYGLKDFIIILTVFDNLCVDVVIKKNSCLSFRPIFQLYQEHLNEYTSTFS